MEMSPVVKNIIGTLVRGLLVFVGGILVKKGIISDAESAVYVEQLLPVVVGLILAGVAIAWGAWQKKHANEKIDLALALPSGTDRAELEKKVDKGVKP